MFLKYSLCRSTAEVRHLDFAKDMNNQMVESGFQAMGQYLHFTKN